jgi:hypothetical protein
MESKEDQTIPPKKSQSKVSSINDSRTSMRLINHTPVQDGLWIGRRTGVVIPLIERGPDGFESFEDLLRFADNLELPARTTINKKPSFVELMASQDDEGGDNVN